MDNRDGRDKELLAVFKAHKVHTPCYAGGGAGKVGSVLSGPTAEQRRRAE